MRKEMNESGINKDLKMQRDTSPKATMNFQIRDLILALVCAFLGSVKGLLVSEIKSLGAIEIFGYRSVGATCFIFPLIIFWSFKVWYDLKSNIVLFLRSLIGNIAVCGYYFGFVYLPIAEASILFYSTPVFTVLIGCMILKEKFGISEFFSIIFSLTGVSLVCLPNLTFDTNRYSSGAIKGIVGSLIGAIAQAAALVIIRKITFVPPAVVSFWWAGMGILFSTALTTAQSKTVIWECGMDPVYIIFIALVGFVSELCLVAALKSTNAVIISLALTSEILWAFLLQIFVSQEIPSLMCVFGGIFIVLSLMLPLTVNYICSKNKQVNLDKSLNKNDRVPSTAVI